MVVVSETGADGAGQHQSASPQASTTVSAPTKLAGAKDQVAVRMSPPIPHVTTNYVGLSHLTMSLVNKAYGDLQNLMETLPSITSDLARKRSLLDYIINSRQEFVKLYVLTKWADVAADVSKCIDVVAWLNGQNNCFANVVNVLFDIERVLGGAKLREPDVETALQVLHYGKPIQPDRGFVPLKKLSAQTVLRTVRELNVLLSIRLALGQSAGAGGEELPPQYRDYEIADGRVRFRVGGTYEVDLGVADDSVDARFFLVDFRFVFEGAGVVPLSVRAPLEVRVNEMLTDQKLADVLHWLLRFAHNYRLSVFHEELLRLERKMWSGVLSHTFYADRSLLVVQYWRSGSRPRSLLEIGLLKSHRIGVRWTREGQQVPYYYLENSFSMESLLEDVTERHVRWIVSSVYRGLVHELYNIPLLQPGDGGDVDDIQNESAGERGGNGDSPMQAADSNSIVTRLGPTKFLLQLSASRHTVFTVDALTGRIALQNSTQLIMSAEKSLNEAQDIVAQGPGLLAQLRFMSMKEEIEMKAGATGWVANSHVHLSPDDIKKYFGTDNSPKLIFTLRRPDWPLSWFLVVAITSAIKQPQWYLSQLESKGKAWVVLFMESINIDASSDRIVGAKMAPLDYRLLEDLGRFATSRFVVQSICADMDANGVQYTLLQESGERRRGLPVIVVNLATLVKSSWAQSALLITIDGQTLFLQGRSQRSLPINCMNTSSVQDLSGVELDAKTGKFKLRIPTTLAIHSLVATVVARLSPVERMLSYIELIESLSLTLTAASIASLTFEYGSGAHATVQLHAMDTSEPIAVTLSENSPHRIVARPLQQLVMDSDLSVLVRLLVVTLPLFKAVEKLQSQFGPSLLVVPRSVSDLRLVMQSRNLALEVRLIKHAYRDMVYVCDVSKEDLGVQSPLPLDLWKKKFPDSSVVPLVKGAVAPVANSQAMLDHVFRPLESIA